MTVTQTLKKRSDDRPEPRWVWPKQNSREAGTMNTLPLALEWLPAELRQAKVFDESNLLLAIFGSRIEHPHGKPGDWYATHWIKWPMSALPNPLLGSDQLAALGVLTDVEQYHARGKRD